MGVTYRKKQTARLVTPREFTKEAFKKAGASKNSRRGEEERPEQEGVKGTSGPGILQRQKAIPRKSTGEGSKLTSS